MHIIGAILRGVTYSDDGGSVLRLETQALSPKDRAELAAFGGQFSYVAFKQESFLRDEVELIGGLKSESAKPKSKSQSLRQILWRLYQVQPEDFVNAEAHYEFYMSKFIKEIRDRLDG